MHTDDYGARGENAITQGGDEFAGLVGESEVIIEIERLEIADNNDLHAREHNVITRGEDRSYPIAENELTSLDAVEIADRNLDAGGESCIMEGMVANAIQDDEGSSRRELEIIVELCDGDEVDGVDGDEGDLVEDFQLAGLINNVIVSNPQEGREFAARMLRLLDDNQD